jgi:C-terminal processing protease CtpA/Prc
VVWTNSEGALIESVLEDGPADQAGIREGDIVTSINGRSLFDPLDDPKAEESLDLDGSLPTQRLLELAQTLEPGDEVEVDFLRDGEPRSATLEAEDLSGWGGNVMFFGDDFEGSWSDEDEPNVFFKGYQGEDAKELYFSPDEGAYEVAFGNYLGTEGYFRSCPTSGDEENFVFLGTDCMGGIRTEGMNPKLGEYFGTDQGVLVADVHEDSPLGLQAGDVILRVGDREVTDPSRLRKIFRSYEPEEEITLHIMRKKQSMTVSGTLAREG